MEPHLFGVGYLWLEVDLLVVWGREKFIYCCSEDFEQRRLWGIISQEGSLGAGHV